MRWGKRAKRFLFFRAFLAPKGARKASLRDSPGIRGKSTNGRNSPGTNPWRLLRVGLFLLASQQGGVPIEIWDVPVVPEEYAYQRVKVRATRSTTRDVEIEHS